MKKAALLPIVLIAGWLLLGTAAALAQQEATSSRPTVTSDVNTGITITPGTRPQPAVSSAPTLSVPVPDIQLQSPRLIEVEGKKYIDIPWIADYVAGAFKYAVGIAAILAAVMMMIGGFQYLTAGGDTGQVMKGKEKITNAILGLSILLASYLVLATVNPELVNLSALRVRYIETVSFKLEADMFEAEELNALPPGTRVCGQGADVMAMRADCRRWCAAHPDPRTWPEYPTSLVPLTEAIPQDIPGVKPNMGTYATPDMIAALRRVGEIATGRNSNYYVVVTSSGRRLSTILGLICATFEPTSGKDPNDYLFSLIGPPNTTPRGHAAGRSVDLFLCDKSGAQLLTCGARTNPRDPNYQGNSEWREGAQILSQIMTEAGFTRYAKEIWHFDLGGNGCSYPSCPFPPPR